MLAISAHGRCSGKSTFRDKQKITRTRSMRTLVKQHSTTGISDRVVLESRKANFCVLIKIELDTGALVSIMPTSSFSSSFIRPAAYRRKSYCVRAYTGENVRPRRRSRQGAAQWPNYRSTSQTNQEHPCLDESHSRHTAHSMSGMGHDLEPKPSPNVRVGFFSSKERKA